MSRFFILRAPLREYKNRSKRRKIRSDRFDIFKRSVIQPDVTAALLSELTNICEKNISSFICITVTVNVII